MAPPPPPRIEREMAVREVGEIRPSRNQHRGGGGFQQQPYYASSAASRPPPPQHLDRSHNSSTSSFTPTTTTTTTTTSSSSYADLANDPPPVRRPPVSTTATSSASSNRVATTISTPTPAAALSEGRARREPPPPSRNDSYYGAESSYNTTTATTPFERSGGGRTSTIELGRGGRGGPRGGRGPGRGGGRFSSNNNNNKPPPSQLSQQHRNVPQQQQQAQQSADDSSFYSRHSNNSSSHANNHPKQNMLKEGRGSGRGGGSVTSGTASREGRERGRRARRGRGGGRYNGGGQGGGSSSYYEGSGTFRSDRSLDEADDSSFAKRRRLAESPPEHSLATETAAVVAPRVRGAQSFGSEGEIMSDDNLDNDVISTDHATATPRDSASIFPSDATLVHPPLSKGSRIPPAPTDTMGGASRMKRELSGDASPLSFRIRQHQGESSLEQQPPAAALSSPTATSKILHRNSSDFRDMDRPSELGNSHNVRDISSHINSSSKDGLGGGIVDNRATDSQRNEVTAAPRFINNQRDGDEIGNTSNSYGPSSSLAWNDNRNNEPPPPRFHSNGDDRYISNNSFYGPGPRSDVRNEPPSLTSARFNNTISHRRDDPTKRFEPIPQTRNNSNRNDVREEQSSIYGPSSSPPPRSTDMRSGEPPSRPPNLDAPAWDEEKRRSFSMMDGFPPSLPRPNEAGPATTLPPPPLPPVMEIDLNHHGHNSNMDRFHAPGRGGVGRGRGGRYSQDGNFGRGRGRHDSGGARGGANRPVGDSNNNFVLHDDFGRAIPGRGDPFLPPHHHRDMPHHEFGSSGRGRGDNFGGRGRGRVGGGGGRGVDNFGARGGGRGPMLDGGPPFDSRGPSPLRMSGAPPPWRPEPPLQLQQPHSSFSRLAQQAPPPIRSPREISGGWNARPRSASPERPMLTTNTELHSNVPFPPPPPLSQTMIKPVPTGSSTATMDAAQSVAVAPPKSPSPSPLEPSGLVLALTRLADLEAQMEYEFTKLMKLGRKQQKLRLEYQVLEQLPVGKEAFEEDYNTKFAAELAGEPGEVV